ncbi:telomere length regulation protein-domain-containing protein [Mucor mucedo]|uniref:telomere length regulation protein-domain-containing protein n=1 Tax=Mucor mucedo TaxID=29922 RepID=UPI00221F1379|nr:telomere length regulation protein-domain-containing protein [Mucor mucedo]KAI7873122.1 telomere length regulation protein-domain-containing protein [Mucor mucedo]
MKNLQEKLSELDQEAQSENAQLDIVLQSISEPLQWLNYNNDSTVTKAEQLSLVNHIVWKRHVWNIFKEILPRWAFTLSSSTHRSLLEATIAWGPDSSVAFAMAKVSLPILIECLSTQDQVSLDTMEMYASCLKYLSLDRSVFKLYCRHASKIDATFLCTLLCSIPGHLANVFRIQLNEVSFGDQHEWYIDRNFYASCSERLAENLDSKSVLFAKEFVSKVTRQGYGDILIKSIYPIARQSPNYWSSVLELSLDQLTGPILQHVKVEILTKQSMNSASKELALILFKDLEASKSLCVDDFLNTALLRLTKASWADDQLARLAICTAIHTKGVKDSKLSPESDALILKYTHRLIETWSDPTFVKHTSFRERTYVTMAILCCIAYLPNAVLDSKIMAEILPSVNTYFNSGDIPTAQLGAIVAEGITSKIDKHNPVKTGLLDSSEELKRIRDLVYVTDAFKEDEGPSPEIDIPHQETEEEVDEDEGFDPDSTYCPDDDEDDDSDDEFQAYQMEEESDDEGLKKQEASKSKAKKPAFIRDLIRYLQDQSDALKLEIGLNAAEQLIRQKMNSGTELSEYSTELARYLISFPETFEIDQFRSLQQNALVALMVAVPEAVTGFIIDQVYDRNTSSGQKQMILSALSLAVRELAGWSPETIVEETRKELEAPQTLGTTLFLSKRIQLEKNRNQVVKKNRLSGLAGPVFFFPLLVGWWEGAQGRIKFWIGNDKVLSERFIMTLNIILHSSTNLPDKRRIVKEYFEFVSSMRYTSHDSVGVKKALLLGIDTIINVSYKDQERLLFQDYTRELTEIRDWLEVIMENNSEAKIQEIALRIVFRLSQISTQMTG